MLLQVRTLTVSFLSKDESLVKYSRRSDQ